MARMMGDIEDTLFEMATSGKTADQSSHYIEAVREVRMKKREIQVRFENRFQNLYDHSVREIKKGNQDNIFAPVQPYTARVVNIMDGGTDRFEQRVEKMRAECRSALFELDKHVSELLLNVPVDNFHNPIQPAMVLGAFQEPCGDIQVGTDVRQLLVDMFDKHMGPALQCVYADLNTLFQSYSTSTQSGTKPIKVENAGSSINPDKADDQPSRLPSLLVGNWVIDKILLQLQYRDVPGFIREFLFSTWRLVLERIYEKQGAASPEWSRAMQIVADLIICAQLTGDKDTRRQQIWMLPGLIYRLKTGMETVAIPLKQQADFLSKLKSHHATITESSVITGRTA